MNPKNALPVAAAAPALLPLIAPYAAPLAVGAAIGLGLIWLFSDDKKPATTNAKTGGEPTDPDAQRKSSGGFVEDLEEEWGMRNTPKTETRLFPTIIGSSEEDEAQSAREAEAQRQQRIRDNEAALARERAQAGSRTTETAQA